MTQMLNAQILRGGESLRTNLVAGQVVHTLATTETTAGGFGAVVLESTIDRQPIPLHYHEKEHDTWLCTRGRLSVWSGDECRILNDGDFAYVKPGDVHSYQCLSPRTQFFGVVAPGGWEGFFDMAGEQWAGPGLPEADHPFDFSRMGPAMGRFGVNRVEGAQYAAPRNGDATDRALPEGPASYFLQQGYGDRVRVQGHLCTTLLSRHISADMIEIRTVEGARGATMPPVRHRQTHVFAYLLEGEVTFAVGDRNVTVHAGAAINIPAGTTYSTKIVSGSGRWVLTSANGNGLSYLDKLGEATQTFTPAREAGKPVTAGQHDLSDIDARIVS
ncbi:cupin domain-containing protein [Pelagibacterium sp.]|uniref:cupin domain-containing protein n=1 Tax=Pelagibacterium sp. TaxID=1967288 RepID=UPI003BADBDF9